LLVVHRESIGEPMRGTPAICRVAACLLAGAVTGCVARDAQPVSPGYEQAPAEVFGAAAYSDAISGPIAAAVTAPDRSEADLALDRGRRPGDVLAFFGIGPSMRVAELGAGGGYMAELLARVVGPGGVVYGQNDPVVLARFAEAPWSERLASPVMSNVVRLDRPFDDPFPADVGSLDAVLNVLFYHDTVWLGTDRDRMNRAVYAALRPGGVYGIVDHSSWPGRGTSEAETLHRIDERFVREEVERAGFVLDESAFFLRNPEDRRDWNASPRSAGELRGTSDRFVLRFVKPQTAP
jgi:predicted methyltransferase